MYTHTIDNKSKITIDSDTEVIDLGENIFKNDNIYANISLTFVRASYGMDMRPDLIARAAYSNEEYTDLLLKYNNIQNPFSVQENDIFMLPSVMQIMDNIGTSAEANAITEDALIRAYKKYVSDSKKPDSNGSEQNNNAIPKSNNNTQNVEYKEANMADKGTSSVKEIAGTLYFGANSGMKCATDGMMTSEAIQAAIKNTIAN